MRIILLFILLTCLGSDCIDIPQPDAFATADIIVHVKIKHIKYIDTKIESNKNEIPLIKMDSTSPRLVTARVVKSWKKHTSNEITLFYFRNPPQGSGYNFDINGEYILYIKNKIDTKWDALQKASDGKEVYEIGECSLRIRKDIKAETKLILISLKSFRQPIKPVR